MVRTTRIRNRSEALLARIVAQAVQRHYGGDAIDVVRAKMVDTARDGDLKANRFWARVYRVMR